MELRSIPPESYDEFRYKVIFGGFKWDPQVGDTNTIARQAVVISQATAHQLAKWAESLAGETLQLEESLLKAPSLYDFLSVPRPLQKALRGVDNYDRHKHVRLMRFDFHPTTQGWSLSEVNSDVPGGFAEAGILPRLASEYLPGTRPFGDLAGSMTQAFLLHLNPNKCVGFVHATSYSDDRQVMEYVANRFAESGFKSAVLAPDHVRWQGGEPTSIAEGQEGKLDGLMRFFPAEWFYDLPRGAKWEGYFSSIVPSCNHPVAVLTQSKRLPLLWDKLGVSVPTWRELLPETTHPKRWELKRGDDWILKPAWGRVGEDITIREAITPKEMRGIGLNARLFPGDWVAQRRFRSQPLQSDEGDMHLCIGVFTVDGQAAGFYGRASTIPRIDSNARDIAVLVANEEVNHHGGL